MFSDRPLGDAELQAELRDRAKEMFIYGYDAYMEHGFPDVRHGLFCMYFCQLVFLSGLMLSLHMIRVNWLQCPVRGKYSIL